MGRQAKPRRAAGAPATADEAAARFREITGIDLRSEPRLLAVHQHLFTWRVVLAAAEYEPLVTAIEQTDAGIRAHSVRAIPTLRPIAVEGSPGENERVAQELSRGLTAAVAKLSEGLIELKACVTLARSTGLLGKVKVGRPEDALARGLCLLLVELVERGGGPTRLTSTQVALVAQAYGVAAPTCAWSDWTERWRRLMNEARAEQPGTKTARQRLLSAMQAIRSGLSRT